MIEDTSRMDRLVERRHGPVRLVVWLLGAAAVLLVLAAARPSLKRWAASDASVDASQVRIGEVTRGDLVRELSVEGRVVAVYHPTVYSPAQGIVTIDVITGQVVERGDLLAEIGSPELASQVAQEEATLGALESSVERLGLEAGQSDEENRLQVKLRRVEATAADRALERAERLFGLGLINEIDLETAHDQVARQSLRLEQAIRTLEMDGQMLRLEKEHARQQLDRQRLVVEELRRRLRALAVTAPVSGLVSSLHVEDRQAVLENDPLVTVVDLSAFEIEIAVAESRADEIVAGVEASLVIDGVTYPAMVASVAPAVEASRVSGRVRFLGEQPAGLKQNQRVTTRLLLEHRHDVVKVPRGPFLEAGGGRIAYVIDNGVAVRRSIEVGGVSVSEVEITSGLEPGERIVISDLERLGGVERALLR